MILRNNVLKAYLKNVYFISGTPCGGKTTVSRELGQSFGIPVYDVDERFPAHRQMSDPALQPAMNASFADADAFFGRSVEEYARWLLDNTREQLDFVLLDLVRLSGETPILCDLHLTAEEAAAITEPDRIIFLIRDPAGLVDDYCNRPDHRDFRDFILSASDPNRAKAVCGATLERINRRRYDEIKRSNYLWLERTADSTVEDTVRRVAVHFGLK